MQEGGCIEQLSRVVMTVYSAFDSKLHMYEDVFFMMIVVVIVADTDGVVDNDSFGHATTKETL